MISLVCMLNSSLTHYIHFVPHTLQSKDVMLLSEALSRNGNREVQIDQSCGLIFYLNYPTAKISLLSSCWGIYLCSTALHFRTVVCLTLLPLKTCLENRQEPIWEMLKNMIRRDKNGIDIKKLVTIIIHIPVYGVFCHYGFAEAWVSMTWRVLHIHTSTRWLPSLWLSCPCNTFFQYL